MAFINLLVNYVDTSDVKNFAHNFYVWEDAENDDLIFIIIFGRIIAVNVRPGDMIRMRKRSIGMRPVDFSYIILYQQAIISIFIC
jgi:hypothetical protein